MLCHSMIHLYYAKNQFTLEKSEHQVIGASLEVFIFQICISKRLNIFYYCIFWIYRISFGRTSATFCTFGWSLGGTIFSLPPQTPLTNEFKQLVHPVV